MSNPLKITTNLEAFGVEVPITFEKRSKNKIRIHLPQHIHDPGEKRFIDLKIEEWGPYPSDGKHAIALSIEDSDSEFSYEVIDLEKKK